jgi:predicted Zn-dependent protease
LQVDGNPPDPPHREATVQYLIDLGYTDPDLVALRESTLRQQLEAELQKAREQYKRGELQNAERTLMQLVADDPDWINPRQLLAEIYYRTAQIERAQAELDWLAEHAVEHPRLALISGAIAIGHRDFASALDELEYARHLEPTLPGVDVLIGTAQLRLGHVDSAEAALQQAIDKKPDDAAAYDGLAAISLQREDSEEAADFALQALEHDMHLFTAHYHLGLALAHLGRPNEAIAAFETAARIHPDRAAPYYRMARIAGEQLQDLQRSNSYRDRGKEIVRRRRQASGA